MNKKRIAISTAIGLLCGLFCAYGTMGMESEAFVVTTGLLAMIVYNRALIGFAVGLAEKVPLHPIARGGLIGIGISLAVSVFSLFDGDVSGGVIFLGFGTVYGVLADVLATRLAK